MSSTPSYSDRSDNSPVYLDVSDDEEEVEKKFDPTQEKDASPSSDVVQDLVRKVASLEKQVAEKEQSRMEKKVDNLADNVEENTKKTQEMFNFMQGFARNFDRMIRDNQMLSSKTRQMIRSYDEAQQFLPRRPVRSESDPVENPLQNAQNSPISTEMEMGSRKAVSAAREELKPTCIFCDRDNHESCQCFRINGSNARICIIEKKKLCTKCLTPNNHSSCPKADEKCSICVVGDHHPMLCDEMEPITSNIARKHICKKYCIFCKMFNHSTAECNKFFLCIPEKRKGRLEKESRCLQCFEFKNPRKEHVCEKGDKKCSICSNIYKDPARAEHHSLLCYPYDDSKPAGGPVKRARSRRIPRAPYPRGPKVDSFRAHSSESD